MNESSPGQYNNDATPWNGEHKTLETNPLVDLHDLIDRIGKQERLNHTARRLIEEHELFDTVAGQHYIKLYEELYGHLNPPVGPVGH
jgi:hypothetical protein